MDTNSADVRMHVVDGIVMGPTYCAYINCEAELLNACGGAFCIVHKQEYGSKCYIVGCQYNKVLPTQACYQHKREREKHIQNQSLGTLASAYQMLKQPAKNLDWQPNIQ